MRWAAQPLFESLEPRLMLSADVVATWIGESGDWWEPANWDIGTVPNNSGGTTYRAVLDVDGDHVITSSHSVTLNDLINAENLRFTGGTSVVHDEVQNAGTVGVEVGTLRFDTAVVTNAGGRVEAAGGTLLLDGTTVAGGTLAVTDDAASSVRFQGDVTLNSLTWDDPGAGEFLVYNTSARLLGDYGQRLPQDYILVVWSDGGADAQLSLVGGVFTNDGTMELRNRGSHYGHQAVLYLEAPVTLVGGGEVLMDRAVFHYGEAPLITGAPGATLTVGPDQGVHGVGEIAVEVVNEGWISADCSEGENDSDRTLALPGPVTNHGGVEAYSRGILAVDGDLVVDEGTVDAYSSGRVDVDGDLVLRGDTELFTSQEESVIEVGGDLVALDPSWPWLSLPNVTFDGAGTPADPQRLEVTSGDDGPTGWAVADDAFSRLELEDDRYVRLIDEGNNSGTPDPEALYAWTLAVDDGATLDLNGLNLYVVRAEIEGSVVGGAIQVVESPASDLFPHNRAEVGTVPVPVAAGDLNEDGKPDLMVGNRDSGTVSVLLGRGDGTFEHQVMYDAGESPRGVALGDLDGDDHLDAVTANVGSEDLSVLLGNGDGTFQDALSVPFGEDPTAVALGDLDKDGALDMVVADKDPSPGRVGVLWGQGDGTFLLGGTYDVGDRPESVALGDLNGDDLLDIVVANTDSWDVSVLLAAGDGTFQAQAPLTAGKYPCSVALGDLDGDDHLDIVAANYNKWNSYNQDCISVFLGVGNGDFLPQTKVLTGDSPQSVALADLNGDDVLDALTANNESNDVTVLLGVGDGSFGPPTAFAAGHGPRFVATEDFNHDGHVDVAVVDDWSDAVSVLLGAGDGTLAADVPPSVLLPGEAKGIALGDVDGDGRTDVVTAVKSRSEVWLLRGSPDGLPAPSATFGVGTTPVAVALADLNGDGRLDVATANYDSDDISVLLNNGSGGFEAEQRFAAGETPHSVALGDTNGDGHLDIIAANAEADQVAVLLGVGDGTFLPAAFYDDPETPADVALGDLDGDGHLDIVTANLGSDDIDVLIGKGDGTFEWDDWYAAGWGWPTPYALALGDVTEDGILDVVCATQYPGAVSVLWGHGDGTFGLWKAYPVAESPTSLALADVNGDGHPDVLVTATEWGDVSVLLGAGDGLFLPPARFNVSRTPYSVAVGRIDDDAHPDIACVQFDGGVAVLLNQAVDVEVGREVSYDALGTPVDYEYWVDVEGLGLSDLQVTTPWAETFRITDYLPPGWAGEDFEHYDAAGGIDIEAGTEDGRRWFEVDWEDLTPGEWASLETGAADLVVTYADGEWPGSADFDGAPLPGEAPTITYPADGQGGVPLEPVFEWHRWAAPGTDAYVDCWVEEVLTRHEPYGAGDLPPDSTWWTTLPSRLDADTDYAFGVTFGNATMERAGEVSLETVSETSSEVTFSTAALGVSVEREVWYDGFPAEETRSYEYAVEITEPGLTRAELATPWGGAFDSALYLGPVWNGVEFLHEEPGFSFWAGADGDHRLFELEWWDLADAQWAALETGTTALDVTYAGGSWSGAADFVGVAVPVAPHMTAPVHGETQVWEASPFQWDGWAAGGPGTRIEVQIERTDTGQEVAQAILPTTATGWAPPALLDPNASYDFDLEFSCQAVVPVNGVDVQTASSAEHAVRFCTEWPWSWIELDWQLAGTTVAPGETVTIPWSGRFTADDRVTLYWDADDNPANNDALACNNGWGVLATDILAWDRQYELTVDVDTPPGAYYLYAVTQNQEEAWIDYTDGPVYVQLQLAWSGALSDRWDLAPNWSPEHEPLAGAQVVFADGAPHQPMLYRNESVEQVDFQTSGWTIGGAGYTLTVGSGGIDSAASGTNTVEPHVTMADDATWTVGADNTLVLGDALSGGGHALTKGGEGTLVLNGGQDHGTGLSLTMNGGTMRLGGRGTLVLQSLTFGSEPTLDLVEGDAVVDYDGASPYGEIADMIRSGLQDGPTGYWDGNGITSSAAAAHPQHLTAVGVIDNSDPDMKIGGLTEFAGVPVDETSVVATYAWWGDANLDGVLNSNDYDMIDTNWLLWTQEARVPEGGFRWAVGDFNYDGTIDSNDYDKIDNAWLLSGGAPCAVGAPAPVSAPATMAWGMDAVLLARESGLAEDAAVGESELAAAQVVLLDHLAVTPAVPQLAPMVEKPVAEEYGIAAPTPWTGTDAPSAASHDLSVDVELPDLLALPALEVLSVP